MSKNRNYLFTLNNYTDAEIELLKKIECNYLVWGYEVGKSGTPHLQGFVAFHNARTIRGITQDKAFKRAHLEESKKPLSAIDYCKKGEQSHEEWTEFGVKGPNYGLNYSGYEFGEFKQGKRTDIMETYEAIKNGKSVDEVIWETPHMYELVHKSMNKLEDIRLRSLRRNFMTEGEWIFGPTGVGKSEYAFQYPNSYVYPYDGGWWDGYAAQEVVVIDEFRGQLPFNELLRMVDKHPNYYVRRRCREPMPFVSKKVIITSALPPWEVFKNLSSDDSLNQLFRRFKIFKIDKNGLELIDPNDHVDDI